MQKIDSVEEFEQLIESGVTFSLLKHSLTCPISHAAHDEYEKFANVNPNFPSYYLTVQESRPLSNYIAEKYNVKHESPQAFIFSNKEISWHASHWKITKDTLNKESQVKL